MPITNNPVPLGKVTVSTAGTPVLAIANFSSDSDFTSLYANKLEVAALPSNSGMIYVGYSGMNRSSLAGVIAMIQPGGSWIFTENAGMNVFDVSRLYLDADTDSNAALVTAHIR